jgi:hypothetical protein
MKPTVLNLLPGKKYLDSNEGGQADTQIALYRGRESQFSLQAVNEAGSTPTLDVKLQEGDLARGESYLVEGAVDAELREGATTNVKLAASFTKSGAASIKKVTLALKKASGIAAGKKLTVKIEGDSSGPDGTAIATSATVDIDTEVTTSYTWVTFTFATPVDLSDSTVYWVVLEGDYTADADANVMWRTKSGLSSGGNSASHDNTSWTADADASREFYTEEIAFTDVTGVAFTQVTDAAAAFQSLTLSVEALKEYIRPHVTITGTSTPAFFAGVTVAVEGTK